mgnify:FL=1
MTEEIIKIIKNIQMNTFSITIILIVFFNVDSVFCKQSENEKSFAGWKTEHVFLNGVVIIR